jgi:hypothetical protein
MSEVIYEPDPLCDGEDALKHKREELKNRLINGRKKNIHGNNDYRKIIIPNSMKTVKIEPYLYGYKNNRDYCILESSTDYEDYNYADEIIGVIIEDIWEVFSDICHRNDRLLEDIKTTVRNIEEMNNNFCNIYSERNNNSKYYERRGVSVPAVVLGDHGPIGNYLIKNGLAFSNYWLHPNEGCLIGFYINNNIRFLEIKFDKYWRFIELLVEFRNF